MKSRVSPLPIFAIFCSIFLSSCVAKQALQEDQALINEMMRSNQMAFDDCYHQAKKKNPTLNGGTLILRFEHAPDGTLVAPRPMKRFFGSAPVERCLQNTLAKVQTARPRTRGPVDLQWSFEGLASAPSNEK